MGRPRKLVDAAPIAIRIPADLLEELDSWAEEVRESGIGTSSVTRSDIVRDIVKKALEERRAQRTAPTPSPAKKQLKKSPR